LLCIPVLCHTYHIPSPSHSPSLCQIQVQILEVLSMRLSPFPCYFFLLDPYMSLSTLFSNNLRLYFPPNVTNQVLHPYKTKLQFCLIKTLYF
jgi:hypothetical protein